MLEFIQNKAARIPIRMLTSAGAPVPGVLSTSLSVTLEKADGTVVDVALDGIVNSWSEITTGAFAGQGKYTLLLGPTNFDTLGSLVISVVAPGSSAMGLAQVEALSPGQIPAAVWDEQLSTHTAVGSAGASLGAVSDIPALAENFTPAPGTPITTNTILTFDVMDNSPIILAVSYGTTTGAEMVFDGNVFRYPYATSSSKLLIPGGVHFTLKRDGGWPATPTIEVL